MTGLRQESEAFLDAYQRLNTEQKLAVDTIDGPVMVIAGPGTGKTQILTLRIAKILLETDTAPESILALTFTESGARAMRERLRTYVGALAYRLPIYTFHGFAETVIKQYPDAYPHIIGGRAATDLERITIIEQILEDAHFTVLRPRGNPAYYVNPILGELSALKRENITLEVLRDAIVREEVALTKIPKIHEKGAHKGKVRSEYQKAEKNLVRNQELVHVYELYQAMLRSEQLYDYDDMMTETVAVLESDESVLRDLQESYQYLLADEHQDVNGAQNRILDLLANYHDTPNIFVVGDEKQAIFRFQGASIQNFLFFEDRFSGTHTITLETNYRSGQTILDAAQDVIAVEDGPLLALRQPLVAATVESGVVSERAFSHQAVEDESLVAAIKALVGEGVSPDEIAVIVRTNREVEALSTRLRAANVPTIASAESDILTHPVT
ncbi:MAG: ATP-dependent helicase, partial [Bacteroidota bacterium]